MHDQAEASCDLPSPQKTSFMIIISWYCPCFRTDLCTVGSYFQSNTTANLVLIGTSLMDILLALFETPMHFLLLRTETML